VEAALTMDEKALESIASASKALVPEVYSDLLKPATKRVGHAVETLFKVGLSPVSMLDYGYNQIADWLRKKLSARIEQTPEEFRVVPPLAISVPLVTQAALTSDAPELCELFAELLSKSIDSRFASTVHPSYAHILSQLSPAEAMVSISFLNLPGLILFDNGLDNQTKKPKEIVEEQFAAYCKNIAGCNRQQALVWLVNLQRLGIVVIESQIDTEFIEKDKADFYAHHKVKTTDFRELILTEFGFAFLNACAPPGFIVSSEPISTGGV
jgi:hypothetical protein